MALLTTVTGTTDSDDVEGWVLPHEHLAIDLTTPTDSVAVVDDWQEVSRELSELREHTGLSLVIEQTCRGMGRNVGQLAALSASTGVSIVAGTGYYYERFHPEGELANNVDKVVDILLSDITVGIDNTGIRAGVLGEIGTSGAAMTAHERNSLTACALASIETGVSIGTHAHLSQGAVQQLELLTKAGVPVDRIALGHQDLTADVKTLYPLLESGAYVAFDTVGKNSYQKDSTRLEMLLRLLEDGFARQLLLSNDISRNSYLLSQGGHGYGHLYRSFRASLIAAGVDQDTLDLLLRANALRWLTAGQEG